MWYPTTLEPSAQLIQLMQLTPGTPVETLSPHSTGRQTRSTEVAAPHCTEVQHRIAQTHRTALHKCAASYCTALHCTEAQHCIAESTVLPLSSDYVLPRCNALAPRHGRTNIGVKTSPTYVVTRFLGGGITILIIKLCCCCFFIM